MNLSLNDPARKGRETVAALYAVWLLAFVPLYMQNGYIGLIAGKYKALLFCTGVAFVGCLLSLRKDGAPSLGLRLADWRSGWVLAWCVCGVCTTLLSQDKITSLYGLAGRKNGFLNLLLCMAGYFMLRACLHAGDVDFAALAFLAGSQVVGVLAWLNQMRLDPLSVYFTLAAGGGEVFLSTVGNINFVGGYAAMALACALGLLQKEPNQKKRIFLNVSLWINAGCLVIASSDGAWLGALAAVAVLIFCYPVSQKLVARLLCLLGALFAAGAFAWFYRVNWGLRGELTGISALLCHPAAIVCAGICFFCAHCFGRRRGGVTVLARAVTGGFFGVCGLLVLVANVTKIPLGALETSIRFGPLWGSNRGYVWGRLLYLYGDELTWLQKLFGVGLDGVYNLLNPHYTEYLVALNAQSFDTAHNEFLQYLLCGGLCMLICFCGFLWVHVRKGISARPFAALALTAYAVQSFFSIANPVLLACAFAMAAFAAMPQATGQEPQNNRLLFAYAMAGMVTFPAILTLLR